MTRRRARRWIAMATAGLVLAAAAAAAAEPEPRLRPAVEVERDLVTLGDLFEGAGARGSQPVLEAPVPGERTLVSIREAFDLANSHGLGWRPVAPFDHVVITRAWRTLDRDEVLREIARTLRGLGAGDNLDINIPANAAKVAVARGAIAELAVEDAAWHASTGRFRATLVVDDGAGPARRHAISGRAWSVVELPVLNARLRRDDVIAAGDIAWKTFRAGRVPNDALARAEDLIGLSPTRTVTPGRPLRASDVDAPIIVDKGALVSIHLVTDRMTLGATGRAQASGALGDAIPVRNTQSKLVVEAIVTGPDRVSVAPAAITLSARED
jgi:flagella basal body P-ring formation protein FlgA